MLRSLVLSYSTFDRPTPIHMLHTIFHTPYSVLVRSNLSASVFYITILTQHDLPAGRKTWLCLFCLISLMRLSLITIQKSSYVWNLGRLEHFCLQNRYITMFETSTTSLCLTCYSAFGTFSCLMLQRKFGKSCNVFKHLGNVALGEQFPSWTTQINGLWFKDETDQSSELDFGCIYAVHHAGLAGTFT